MDIDSKGFAYLGQNTVRKYDTKTGKLVGEIPHTPELENGGKFGRRNAAAHAGRRRPGTGRRLPAAASGAAGRGGRGGNAPDPRRRRRRARRSAEVPAHDADDRRRHRGDSLDEPANEVYVADNYLGGRVMVFDMNTFPQERMGCVRTQAVGKSRRTTQTGVRRASRRRIQGHLTLNFPTTVRMRPIAPRTHSRHDERTEVRQGVHLAAGQAERLGPRRRGGVCLFAGQGAERYLYIGDIKKQHDLVPQS
jgi:hypothetical protein